MKFRPPRRPDMLGWRTGGVGTAQQHCQTKRGSSAASQSLHHRTERRVVIVTKLACYSGILLLLYATLYHLVDPPGPEDAAASSLWNRWGGSTAVGTGTTDSIVGSGGREPDDTVPTTRSGLTGTRTSTEEDANKNGSTDNDDDPATYYFPKWPDDAVHGGVSVRALVGAMRACALGYSGHTVAALPVCSKIYIVDDHAQLWSSQLLYENGATTNRRVDRTEPFLRDALLRTAATTTRMTTTIRGHHYPRLLRALTAGGGFGFMVNYNDTVECFNNTSVFLDRWLPAIISTTTNDNDDDDDESVDGGSAKNAAAAHTIFRGLDDLQRAVAIPLFTTSSPLDDSCRFAYPMVNYQMIADCIPSSSNSWRYPFSWLGRHIMVHYIDPLRYRHDPFHPQQLQAVWRGTATGNKNRLHNVRYQLCNISYHYPHLIDAKLVGTPPPFWRDDDDHDHHENRHGNLTSSISILYMYGDRIHSRDFQRYRAILDVDGHAWSSRFTKLLCYSSSVVLKVDPQYGDALYGTMQPWVHYIPVVGGGDGGNLTADLLAKIQFVLDHPDRVDRIIRNANAWCTRYLRMDQLETTLLRMLEHYLSRLELYDANWQRTWNDEVRELRSELNFSLVGAG
jgi:hypothetical protein